MMACTYLGCRLAILKARSIVQEDSQENSFNPSHLNGFKLFFNLKIGFKLYLSRTYLLGRTKHSHVHPHRPREAKSGTQSKTELKFAAFYPEFLFLLLFLNLLFKYSLHLNVRLGDILFT